MKLLKEEIQDVQFLTEEKNGKKDHYIQGIFMMAERVNKNGRVYPFHVLEKEAIRYNKEMIDRKCAYGELNHPDTPNINLDKVSHMITQLYPDGKNFIGKAKLMDTPSGRIAKSLLEGGGALGVSTRGVGSLKPCNGYQLVQDDFHLATAADIVANPSAPDAWVNSIMENKEWLLTSKGWQSVNGVDYDTAKRQLEEANQHKIEEVALKLFKNLVRSF